MELFVLENDFQFDDIFLNIKYDGPSFKGVMNIYDLGNELIGLEYCIKTILLRLLKEDKKNITNKTLKEEIKNLNIDDFELITEGFVNNCFLKKIKFGKTNKFVSFLDQIEKRPELNKYILGIIVGSMTLYGTIYVAQINADKDIMIKAIEKGIISNEVAENIQKSSLSDESKKIALELISDKKFREESSKTVLPIKNKDDYLEISSEAFKIIGQEKIRIDNSNKDIFLINKGSIIDDEGEYEKYDLIEGRISSIRLDADKNQIGFKVLNEGGEINCHLIDTLNIENFKDLLGEWVELEGKIIYGDEKVKNIEIFNIKKIPPPLSEAKQITLIK